MRASPSQAAGSAGQTTGAPGSVAPRLSNEEVRIAKFAGSALAVAAGILSILSVFATWWIATTGGVSTSFYPGLRYKAAGTWYTYASTGFGQVGGLFLAVLVLGIVAGILLLIAGGLMFVEALGKRSLSAGRIAGLAVAGIVLEVAAAAAAPGLQPWAIRTSSGGSTFCSGWTGTSPCNAFWGSGSHGAASFTFVGADGWIVMIGAMFLAILGLAIRYLGRNPPDTGPA